MSLVYSLNVFIEYRVYFNLLGLLVMLSTCICIGIELTCTLGGGGGLIYLHVQYNNLIII